MEFSFPYQTNSHISEVTDTLILHTNTIGGSRGGVPGTRSPMGPNSFVFAYIFTEKHPCRWSTPPPNGCTPPSTGNPVSATEH